MPAASPPPSPFLSLSRELTPAQRRALWAAALGWALDGMDAMLYAFALSAIQREFELSSGTAGALASVTLVCSAVGGVLFGVLADRLGRARALMLAVLAYSLCTAATATARSLPELVLWRALLGLGLGGEWSAGAVLVAESVPAHRRGQALGLVQSGWAVGYALAALVAALVLPRWGWRALFLVGVSPALLAAWVRARVEEPAAWRAARDPSARLPAAAPTPSGLALLLRPPLRRRAVLATLLATSLLCAYWGLFTWIPTYLSTPVERGGVGLSLVRALPFLLPMQAGAFAGYVCFGVLADRLGRRPVFAAFVLAAAAAVPGFALLAHRPGWLLLLAPLLGFAGHGYFSVFGALLAELFPGPIRATAQGACYSTGRAVSALAPFAVGGLAERWGLGAALSATCGLYVVGALLIWTLPETRGEELA
ncbi:MAG: MFS transporter [Polyangia bacterium]